MNKKKLLILAVVLLIGLIGVEGYFYVSSGKSNVDELQDVGNVSKEPSKKDMSKYLVDIYTPYNKDNLTYTLKKEDRAMYYLIEDGLVDGNIQKKVNDEIKNKIKTLREKYKNQNITGKVLSNFENTISIVFEIVDEKPNTEDFSNYLDREYLYSFVDSLNVDLTTGEQIKFEDVIADSSILRSILVKQMEENLGKYIGLVCNVGPCENPNPDYSVLEEEYLMIMNKFNSGKYLFAFSPTKIYFHFDDVSIYDPELEYDIHDKKICESKGYKYVTDMGCIDYNHYLTMYDNKIEFYSISDSVIIYDRFKTDKKIYKNSSTVVDRKFTTGWEEIMDSRMIETDNSLIDYNLFNYNLDQKVLDNVYNEVIKESSSMKKENFNVINYNGQIFESLGEKYIYIYFDVNHYNMSKDDYFKNKKQIYLDKYTRYTFDEGILWYRYGYDYLSNYFTKKNYYYYIYDESGNSIRTKEIFSKTFDFSTIIPSSWWGNGSARDLLDKSLVIVNNNSFESPNYLVFYIDEHQGNIFMKYKRQKINLTSGYLETDNMIKNIFEIEE